MTVIQLIKKLIKIQNFAVTQSRMSNQERMIHILILVNQVSIMQSQKPSDHSIFVHTDKCVNALMQGIQIQNVACIIVKILLCIKLSRRAHLH
jgi:hypothetical protein